MIPGWLEALALNLIKRRKPHRKTAEDLADYYGVPYLRVVKAIEAYSTEKEERLRETLASIIRHERDCHHGCQSSINAAMVALEP